MKNFWEILPLIMVVLFLLLASYLFFAPGPWRVSYFVRLLVGAVLLVYAGVRVAFWYKRWKNYKSTRV